MPISLSNPAGLVTPPDVYHHVSIATGSRFVFVAGQVAWDVEGVTVGEGDLAAQVEQCYLNVSIALAEVHASFDDVAKVTIYVVDLTPDKVALVLDGIDRAAERLGTDHAPPGSLIGVAALNAPDHLVEIEATAVVA
jgi:enamine deaminase RidA (YjgF/YER057c/UK114 family)